MTVPRQSGKTTIVRVIVGARALASERRLSYYTAQTGRDAVERWRDMADLIERSPLAKLVHKRVAAGDQRLTFTPTGSRFHPFAPTPESLHGYTPHDVVLDEVFKFSEGQGNDLMGAIVPAQQTLRDRQLILTSTAGHRDSTFLRAKVDAARAALGDPSSRLGYLEWSLPAGADPWDRSEWGFHPALGHNLSLEDLEATAEQFADRPGEWIRAVCNRWTDTRDSVFDMATWDAAGVALVRPRARRPVVGFEVAGGRAAAVVAFLYADGRPAVETLLSSDDPGQFTADVVDMAGWADLWADDAADTRTVVDAVRRAVGDDRVRTLSQRDYAAACAEFSAALRSGRVVHDAGDRDLRGAVEGAQVRRAGEATVFRHEGNHPALVAATVAVRGLLSQPRAVPAPDFRFG